jgi:hypothetical protein
MRKIHRQNIEKRSPKPRSTSCGPTFQTRTYTALGDDAKGVNPRETRYRGLGRHRRPFSPLTVKTHVTRAIAKLGVRDRVQLVITAYETGLVRPGGG